MTDSCMCGCEFEGLILDFLASTINNAQMSELLWQREKAGFASSFSYSMIKINGHMLSTVVSVQQLMTQRLLNSHKQKMGFGVATVCKSGQTPLFQWE